MKLKLLSAVASGVFVLAVASATGLATHMVGRQAEANVAQARTVEVLRATATRIAEQKQNTLVIAVTIPAPETIVSNDSAGIPLHEAPTAQVEALNPPVTIYPQPLQPTSTNVPHGHATVNAIADQRSTGTPMATDTATSTPLAFPISTITPTPAATSAEDLAVIPVATELLPTATFAATLTIEPPPTPAPTDVPKVTEAPPTETAEPTVTPAPLPSDTPEPSATPTIEPTVTDSPLGSPLATPTIYETSTAVP